MVLRAQPSWPKGTKREEVGQVTHGKGDQSVFQFPDRRNLEEAVQLQAARSDGR